MAKNKLRMVVEAEVKSALKDFDNLNKKLHNTKKQADPLTKAFSSMKAQLLGLAGGAIAFTTISNGIRESVEAYKEQLTAELKLQSALKATGNAVGLSKEQLTDYAKELSQLTGISDESLTSAQAVMLTFTQIGKDVFPSAIQAAADMSAMFGNDLQSSVIQLGKALNDPIKGVGALGEVGISFNESQREQIRLLQESGDIMGAQNVILDELNREFGGVAETIGADVVGSLDKFDNAIDNAKESMGEDFVTAAQPLIDTFTEIINKAVEAAEETRNYADTLDLIHGRKSIDSVKNYQIAIDSLTEELEKNKQKQEELQEKIANGDYYNNQVKAGYIEAIKLYDENNAKIREQLTELESLNEAKKASEEITRKENEAQAEQSKIQEERKKQLSEYAAWVEAEYRKTEEFAEKETQLAYERAKANYEASEVGDWDYDQIKAIYEYYDAIVNKKEESNNTPLESSEVLNEYETKLKSVENELNRIAKERLNTAGAERAYYDQRLQSLSEEYNELQGITDELSNYEKGVKEITDAWDKAKSVMSDFSGVTDALGGVYSEWSKLQDAEFRKYEQQMQARIDEAKEAADTQIEILQEQYAAQYESLEENLDNDIISREEYLARKEELEAEQKAKEAEARAVEEALQAELKKKQNEEGRKQFKVEQAQNIASATMAGANAVVQALTLGPFLGPAMAAVIAGMTAAQIGIIASQEYVPLAKGGITTGPTTALIGEGGEPEMVLPLSKAEQMGFGNSGQSVNYVININGNAYGVKDIETHVFNGIQRAQKMNNLPRWSYVN